jgi:hypothetical protein
MGLTNTYAAAGTPLDELMALYLSCPAVQAQTRVAFRFFRFQLVAPPSGDWGDGLSRTIPCLPRQRATADPTKAALKQFAIIAEDLKQPSGPVTAAA